MQLGSTLGRSWNIKLLAGTLVWFRIPVE